ncbi:hypothetical protein AVEN_154856-1 [Araneus ventricosus]|uniref:Uncharacterized protein n=1 Tax=Araneus ventricosus TaxID=182803 RepID=A0A4Y2RRI0_ARAVE|nr:hypothetical protein AVEN_154856-1 [Araneus ventricosus]
MYVGPLWPFAVYVGPLWPVALYVGPLWPVAVYVGLLLVKTYEGVKRPRVDVVRKFEEGVPVQVSSSASYRGSKLRGPSQKSPRVASKRDVNITKLS